MTEKNACNAGLSKEAFDYLLDSLEEARQKASIEQTAWTALFHIARGDNVCIESLSEEEARLVFERLKELQETYFPNTKSQAGLASDSADAT